MVNGENASEFISYMKCRLQMFSYLFSQDMERAVNVSDLIYIENRVS